MKSKLLKLPQQKNCKINRSPIPNYTIKNYAPPDEIEAITNLQAIILGRNKNGHTKDKTMEQFNVPLQINNDHPI